jgi:hypothetical protein
MRSIEPSLAAINHWVPVALICTDQFAKLKARVEKRTGWTAEQLEHRVKRYNRLADAPTKQDLEAVAARLLRMRWNAREQAWSLPGPLAPPDFINLVAGYGMTCKMRLPAVADTIREAWYRAHHNGRPYPIAADIQKALLDYLIPYDKALQGAFGASKTPSAYVSNSGLQRLCNQPATSMPRL